MPFHTDFFIDQKSQLIGNTITGLYFFFSELIKKQKKKIKNILRNRQIILQNATYMRKKWVYIEDGPQKTILL